MDTIFTDGQLTKAIETMRQKGMTPDRFSRLLGSGIFADVCDPGACLDNRDAVRQALKLDAVVVEPLVIEVDFNQTLETMIAAGHYDWTNSDITSKRFPIMGAGVVRVEAKVFHFGRDISSEDAEAAIKAEGWEPAPIEQLSAFGAKFPDEQRKYPIIGLGSSARVRGDRRVPCLDRVGSERGLNLDWWGGRWDGFCRFLAVRKQSSAV